MLDLFLNKLNHYKDQVALVDSNRSYTYRELLESIDKKSNNMSRGQRKIQVVLVDHSFDTLSTLLALWVNKNTVLPISPEGVFSDQANFINDVENNPALQRWQMKNQSGLLLMSSGSTRKAKFVLHNFEHFLEKYYQQLPKSYRILDFHLWDHLAGLDVLFSTLASGSVLILSPKKTISIIESLIKTQSISVLPITPTFLNLLFWEYRNRVFPEVEKVVLGSEPMRASIQKMYTLFPNAQWLQKFGTTETGRIEGLRGSVQKGFALNPEKVQVRNNILWIKCPKSLIGYIGKSDLKLSGDWMCTNDRVTLQNQGHFQITGRKDSFFNVGGEKVFPYPIEQTLQKHPQVISAKVNGVKNPLMGTVLEAKILWEGECQSMTSQLRKHCKAQKLPHIKIPVRFYRVSNLEYSSRFKQL